MENLPKVTFPTVIDNTILTSFAECGYKGYLQYLRHLRRKAPAVHLLFGGAYAHGLDFIRKNRYHAPHTAKEKIILAGIMEAWKFYGDYTPTEGVSGHLKTGERLARLIWDHFEHFGWKGDFLQPAVSGNKPMVEFSFAIPLDIAHPETGEPILYGGRADMIAINTTTGGMYVVDDKTCSQMGPSWVNSFDLRSQFTGYTFAAQQCGYDVAGAIVRGACILKHENKFLDSIQLRPNWMIDRWLEQVYIKIASMIEQWKHGAYTMDFGSACELYGGCPFKEVCLKKEHEPWIKDNFIVEEWNPVAKIDPEELRNGKSKSVSSTNGDNSQDLVFDSVAGS